MKGTNGFTTLLPTTTASGSSFMNRLDLISVTILGSVIALCTLICCCVGLRKRKVLPNESQLVDIHHTDELDRSNTFGAELRYPQRLEPHHREPRTPDSPPPTYSVLERQMSFTSSISQSSSQIEMPPNYEEAAGLARHSLMSTLIPEEGPAVETIVTKEMASYRRSESAYHNQPTRPKRANRSKSDIEKSRRSRNQHSIEVHSPPVDISTIIESTTTLSPPDLLRKPLDTPGSDAPLLTSEKPQEHLRSVQVRPSSDSTVTTTSPSKPKMSRSSTDV